MMQVVRGKAVLELGAGTGISAKGYKEADARKVIMSDVEDDILDRMADNCGGDVDVRLVDLMDSKEVARLVREEEIEAVVVADLCYSPVLVEGISEVVREVADQTEIWVFVAERSEMSGSVGDVLREHSEVHKFEGRELWKGGGFEYLEGCYVKDEIDKVVAYRCKR